ncbi:MAG: tail fiber domain-containing protein [Candidatus Binatales bacterium]
MVRVKHKGIWTSIAVSLAVTLVVALAGTGTAVAQNTHYGTGACGSTGSCGGATNDSAFGYDALYSNGVYANSNTGVGWDALYYNTASDYNTAIGVQALYNNTVESNTAVGFAALYTNSTGTPNTAVGWEALLNTTGSNNIGLGWYAGGSLTTGSYDIDIGSNGVAGESDTIRIGTSGTQTATYVAGISGTTVTGSDVVVSSIGQLGVASSSARFKRDINDMGNASSKLMRLRPVTFRYKNDQQGIKQYGLIGEEVDRVYPELVVHDQDGKVISVRYSMLAPMLLNEVQKQAGQNRQLSAQVARLTQQIGALKKKDAQIDALNERMNAVERQVRVARPEHLASAMP